MATLNENWISGFVDGEGSFSVKIELSQARKVRFSFSISQKEFSILNEIKKFFGFGHVYGKNGGVFSYQVCKREDIEKIIEFFNNYPLKSRKYKDFIIFKECFYLTKKSERKSKAQILKIAKLREGMVRGVKRSKFMQTYDYLKEILKEDEHI